MTGIQNCVSPCTLYWMPQAPAHAGTPAADYDASKVLPGLVEYQPPWNEGCSGATDPDISDKPYVLRTYSDMLAGQAVEAQQDRRLAPGGRQSPARDDRRVPRQGPVSSEANHLHFRSRPRARQPSCRDERGRVRDDRAGAAVHLRQRRARRRGRQVGEPPRHPGHAARLAAGHAAAAARRPQPRAAVHRPRPRTGTRTPTSPISRPRPSCTISVRSGRCAKTAWSRPPEPPLPQGRAVSRGRSTDQAAGHC